MTDKVKFDFKPWRFKRFREPLSEVGSPIKEVFSSKLDSDGNIVLEKVGEENIYDYIQSFAESVDINSIMARYQNGDVDALNKVQGFFGDFTDVPDSWVDVLNTVNRGRENFERMPIEFKEKYGNDFARFVCTFDFNDLASSVAEPNSAPVIEKEVIADES